MDENKETITNPTPEAAQPENNPTEMTPEQWTARMAELIADNKRLKAAVDKATSDASNWKKKYTATQSDADRLNMEKAEEEARRKQEFEDLKKFKAVTEASDQYRRLGYSDEMAKSAAEAQFAGDFEELNRIQQTFQDELTKRIKADMMKSMPVPSIGNDDSVQMTKEQFNKLSYAEQVKLRREHPTVYEKLAQ